MRLAWLLLLCACPGGGGGNTPHTDTSVKDVVGKLAAKRASMTSFRAKSVMDYWFNNQKVKGDVLVMGQAGAKVRINALNPMGGTVLADLACDGKTFYYINFQANCELTGPCTKQSIANLLNVELEPDDFLHLALGTPPVIEGDGKATWDDKAGEEHVELKDAAGTQTMTLSSKDDVLASKLVDPQGNRVWELDNKDFKDSKDAKGAAIRLPSKTRFQTASQNGDLIIDWDEVEVNVDLDPSKFVLQLQGLPRCGPPQPQSAPQAPAGGTHP
jgi:outer membrane lipoprotein-sorting protein